MYRFEENIVDSNVSAEPIIEHILHYVDSLWQDINPHCNKITDPPGWFLPIMSKKQLLSELHRQNKLIIVRFKLVDNSRRPLR